VLGVRLLGHIWAAPTTLVGLLVTLFGARFLRLASDTLLFVARPGSAVAWFFKARGVVAFTLGAVIVFVDEAHAASPRLLAHERRHTLQALWLGPLFLPVYGLCSLWAWARGRAAYADNALEVDARSAESRL
jgi:hypothetical protein